jgi:GNAT superfamily N-acetyltransferase
VNIRLANREDSAAIAEFNQAMALETEGKHLPPETISRGVAAVFDDPQKGFYVVAEDDRRVVGCLMITYEWSDWRAGWFWWIQSVYIRPDARGQRIYSRVYAFLKSLAAERGDVCGFRLYAETENRHAQMVYEKVGMRAPHYVMFEEEI